MSPAAFAALQTFSARAVYVDGKHKLWNEIRELQKAGMVRLKWVGADSRVQSKDKPTAQVVPTDKGIEALAQSVKK